MAIVIVDDGTLDTVLKCDECGREFRFTYQNDAGEGSYDEFVLMAVDHVQLEHECDEEE